MLLDQAKGPPNGRSKRLGGEEYPVVNGKGPRTRPGASRPLRRLPAHAADQVRPRFNVLHVSAFNLRQRLPEIPQAAGDPVQGIRTQSAWRIRAGLNRRSVIETVFR